MRAWPFLYVNYVLQYVNGHAGSLSTFVHKGHPTMIVYNIPFQLVTGSLSTVKDGDHTDVNLQHKVLFD